VPCLGVWPLVRVHVLDFKLVHMCWEQLPVGEWADCVLIVNLAVADDAGLGKMLSLIFLVLKMKGSQEEEEWMAKPPAGDGG